MPFHLAAVSFTSVTATPVVDPDLASADHPDFVFRCSRLNHQIVSFRAMGVLGGNVFI
jgi:hypothetical protein